MKNTPKINLHLPRSLSPARYMSRNKSPTPQGDSASKGGSLQTSSTSKGGASSTTIQAGKLQPGAAALPIAKGSATGNPRNKCALQPGHSLMDWIRLGNSGKDLSGMGGRVLAVTPKELSTHNQIGNAWIAIRGRVYNITDYLNYHPGGPEELLRGAGKDATHLFDQVHAWVNYESLLSKCLIGPLRQNEISDEELKNIFFGDMNDSPKSLGKQKAPDILRKSMESLKSSNSNKSQTNEKKDSLSNTDLGTAKSSSESSLNVNETKTNEDTTSNKSTPAVSIVVNDDTPKEQNLASQFKYPTLTLTKADSIKSNASEAMIDGTNRQVSEQTEKQTPPKFDWIQKMDTVTLIFYTKQFCNPHCSVILTDDSKTDILVIFNYDFYTYKFDLSLEGSVKWPCWVVINYETGKVEINLSKETSKIWNSYGAMNDSHITEQNVTTEQNSIACSVVDKWEINHNTSILLIKPNSNEFISFPVGYHSRVSCPDDDILSRAYTPIPPYMLSEFRPANWATDLICLMVKKYDQGAVSTWLTSREKQEKVAITRPLGSFGLKTLQEVSQMCLIAAGTGVTPMLNIIQFALQRRNPRSKMVDLLFFNRSERDILWHDQLSALVAKDERFHLTNILSDPSQHWDGIKSHINQAVLISHLTKLYQPQDAEASSTPGDPSPTSSPSKQLVEKIFQQNGKELFVCVCGPSLFTQLTRSLLSGLGCSEEQMYCFFG